MNSNHSRGALGVALLACAACTVDAQAQPAPASAASPAPATLAPVTITANPLGGAEIVTPSEQYSGTGLLLRSQGTLGETLSGTPGVSSTYFGPNASRPTIRGLDGDRIRILANSGASVDASSVSADHAVASDPISVERIEVLRGPGALLYGGSAVGGVVNLIDNRIPREPSPGVSGHADLGLATGNRERGGGVAVDGGTSRVGLHVDAFDRRTSDVRVPVELACTQAGVTRFSSRICNSASSVRGGAVGGSLFFDKGYLGASAATYRNDYGTVAEDEVTIGMRSNRYALEGEWRDVGGPLKSIKAQASHTDYMHTEFEAGEPGTVFRNAGSDLRVELRHAPWGKLNGVVGLQAENTRFSAEGEEAFAPHSNTRQVALFAFEELGLRWGKLIFGARRENVDVTSTGNALVPRFALGSRSFSPSSLAAGVLWNVAPEWQLTSNLSSTRRAPKDYELFANGPHLATHAWEIGDANLREERSTNLDLGLQWKRGPHSVKVNAFASRFANYISLQRTGATQSVNGEELPEFMFAPVRASFRGAEAGGKFRLREAASSTLDLELRSDIVRATNRDTGEPLPRIAPWRAGATLLWERGDWGARAGFDHFGAQSRVPAGDVPTGSYTLWNAALTYRMDAGRANLLWFARLDNAGNRLAYSATSVLTQTAPGKSPLPGRSLKVGVQAAF